jgi:hypothetical protein
VGIRWNRYPKVKSLGADLLVFLQFYVQQQQQQKNIYLTSKLGFQLYLLFI